MHSSDAAKVRPAFQKMRFPSPQLADQVTESARYACWSCKEWASLRAEGLWGGLVALATFVGGWADERSVYTPPGAANQSHFFDVFSDVFLERFWVVFGTHFGPTFGLKCCQNGFENQRKIDTENVSKIDAKIVEKWALKGYEIYVFQTLCWKCWTC